MPTSCAASPSCPDDCWSVDVKRSLAFFLAVSLPSIANGGVDGVSSQMNVKNGVLAIVSKRCKIYARLPLPRFLSC